MFELNVKKLFYDGSCKLCRREINLLRDKLTAHIQLVDISAPDFEGFAGVSKQQMMQQIHLWQDDHFIIGIDATLHYWQIAGYRKLVSLIKLPPCYWIAKKAYGFWAKRRQSCTNNQCDI